MNFIKNLSLACSYIADNIGSNQALKQEFQNTSTRIMLILKNYSPSIKDMLDREVNYTLNLIDLGVVDGSVTAADADIFRRGVLKVKAQLRERTVSKISLSHLFEQDIIDNQEKEVQKIEKINEEKEEEIKPIEAAKEEIENIILSNQEVTSRDRKKMILAVISRQASGLKELRELIPNTNDKTLQRDLNDLIRDRKILRLGSKRWAKYYIK